MFFSPQVSKSAHPSRQEAGSSPGKGSGGLEAGVVSYAVTGVPTPSSVEKNATSGGDINSRGDRPSKNGNNCLAAGVLEGLRSDMASPQPWKTSPSGWKKETL